MKTRVGIVGTGFAATSHVDALRRLGGVEVVAVAGRSEARAAETAARLSIPRAYGSPEALIADGDVDAVHNCTPNDVHAEVSAAVLTAGKHLLSEKPLAIDSRESGSLVALAAAAAERGVVSGVCFNYRFYPLIVELRDRLAAGEQGAVHLVHGGYLQDWLLYDTDWSWRIDPSVNGPSRAVADIGSHWMDLLQYVVGSRIVSVFADLGTLHSVRWEVDHARTFGSAADGGRPFPVDTEDFGTIVVRFADGARGSLVLSQVSAGHKNRLYFTVEAGGASYSWDQEEPNRLGIGHRDRPNEQLLRDPSLLGGNAAALTRFPGGHQEGWPDGLRGLFADFYGAVDAARAGTPYAGSFATFEDGHQIVQLVEAVIASHRSRTWADVGPLEERSEVPAGGEATVA